jgi:pimeloyl-ACP methyl ester carboxylesterase
MSMFPEQDHIWFNERPFTLKIWPSFGHCDFYWRLAVFVMMAVLVFPATGLADDDVPTPDFEWHICGAIEDYECATVFVVLADDNESNRLRNPVVFLEGWDGEGKHSMKSLWDRLGGDEDERLLQRLLARGQDVILVDWDDPQSRIQRNGDVLFSVLEEVDMMTSEEATCGEPVVVGTSMGGLVARWALMHMENSGALDDSPIREFISMDTPHRGVNSPLALQALAKEFNFISAIEERWDDITRGSAQQLFLTHIQGPRYKEHENRGLFVSELRDMGDFPRDMRKVAVANGSCTGKSQGYNGGDFVSRMRVPVWAAQIILPGLPILEYYVKLFAYPDPNEGKDYVYRSLVYLPSGIPWWPIVIADNQYYPLLTRSTPSYDTVPGGKIDYWRQLEKDSRLTDWVFSTEHAFACAVPTVSALDIDTEDYYYHDSLENMVERTPFNAIYCQQENQKHVSFHSGHSGNIEFLLGEIAPSDLELCGTVEEGEVDKRAAIDNMTVSKDNCGFVVESGGKVELKARDFIRLEPGFHAKRGSTFSARIGSCG